jgi:hypothetical protein
MFHGDLDSDQALSIHVDIDTMVHLNVLDK